MSHEGELIAAPVIDGLNAGAPAPPVLDVRRARSISSGSDSYTYRTKVGFSVSSDSLPPPPEPEMSSDAGPTGAVHDDVSWIVHLPHDDLELFVGELRAAAEGGDVADVAQLLEEWRATAEVHADPELHKALTRPTSGDYGAVPSPLS
jgi:hypothetical protein